METETKKSSGGKALLIVAGLGLGGVCLCVAFVAGIITVVFGAIRSSDVYVEAVNIATNDAAVINALGEPVEAGFFVSGSVNTSGNTGDADLVIPLSGPNGSGSLRAVATKSGSTWNYSLLEFTLDNGTVIPVSLPGR